MYTVVSHEAKEKVQIGQFLLFDQAIKEMEMQKNNETSLRLIKKFESQNRIKHIHVIHHHIQKLIDNEKLEIL